MRLNRTLSPSQREALKKRWPAQTIEQRFWNKVKKTPSCWLWTARTIPSGYGQFQIQARLWEYAHRLAYCFSKGSIPANKHVLHICDVRACVNPAHLWLGTHKENMSDMRQKRRLKQCSA